MVTKAGGAIGAPNIFVNDIEFGIEGIMTATRSLSIAALSGTWNRFGAKVIFLSDGLAEMY